MIYEYRVYTAEPGKMDALHRRFTTKTISLFKKHGMKVIGFWEPEGKQGEVLTYILGYESPQQMDRAWKAFLDDPEWKTAKAESEKNGPLVAKIERTLLQPTSYSPLK